MIGNQSFERILPDPAQESVWDYPRPPRLEPANKHIEVWFNDAKIADSRQAFRVIETSHPPTYYIPPEDVDTRVLRQTRQASMCEWKGTASYFNVTSGNRSAANAAWSYLHPTPAFEPIAGYIAFYPASMDECRVDDIPVLSQPGQFYGGWITPDIVGPFKGEPGTWGW